MLLVAIPFLFFSNPDGTYTVDAQAFKARFADSAITFTRGKSTVTLTFPGADPHPKLEKLDTFTVRASFFTGNQVLQTTIPTALAYRNLYPGIDAIWRNRGRELKSEFVVSPNTNPVNIRLQYRGASRLTVGQDGALLVQTASGTLRESPPVLYQIAMSGRRIPVEGSFRVSSPTTVRFNVGRYDRNLPLYIDPTVSYSSYNGGSRNDTVSSVATDASGNIYVAGWTDSTNFPTKTPLRTFGGNTDAFVMKFDATGKNLIWATYLGGSADDRAQGIAVDGSGNVWVVGYTTSANFPTAQPLQSRRLGSRDAFIAKISASGGSLLFSTYFGGSGADTANAVSLDGAGLAYIAGETDSTDFPTRSPLQTRSGGRRDAFLVKLNLTYTVAFSTYLGGRGDDRATALAVSTDGTPFLAGCTASSDFPTRLPAQSGLLGNGDAFVARVNPDGASLFYSTFLGGTNVSDCASAIAVDSNLSAYVTGTTASADFPLLGAYQVKHAGGGLDSFVTKLSAGGVLAYSTYLGGKSVDIASAIRVDSLTRAYIAGYTSSTNFPTTSPLQATFAGVYDGFLVRLEASGAYTNFSTFLGGTGSDTPLAMVLTAAGDAVIVGSTGSAQYPVVNALQGTRSGNTDGFITKISGVTF